MINTIIDEANDSYVFGVTYNEEKTRARVEEKENLTHAPFFIGGSGRLAVITMDTRQ